MTRATLANAGPAATLCRADVARDLGILEDSPLSTVLIADNDRAVSGLLAEVLARVGLRPTNAYDGVAAHELVLRTAPRVLVCDLDMPGMSGLEVIESLAALPVPPQVVVVSGYLDGRAEARLAQLPFVREVLRKPFDLLRFAATVERLCSGERREGDVSGESAGSAAGAAP